MGDQLRKQAEMFLDASVTEVVVTVPSRYGKHQRESILEACRHARLNVLGLIKSSTSAGVAYVLANPNQSKRNVLVCDIGKSYFDFSLLRVEDGELTEKAIGTDFVDLDN